MRSLRSLEGYALIDNRNSPGVPDEIVVAQGLPPGAGIGKFETATFTCSHCEQVVARLTRPETAPRLREAGFCRKCNHYICQNCEAQKLADGGVCYPYKARIADAREALEKGESVETVYDRIFIRGDRAVQVSLLIA